MRQFEYSEGLIERKCKNEKCGRTFYITATVSRTERAVFCSTACFRSWQKENKGKIRFKHHGINNYTELHRKYALQWQKENPEKSRAQRLARVYPEYVTVIYECACDTNQKENHHFDYELPYVVLRLCSRCHAAEHKRLRSLKAA